MAPENPLLSVENLTIRFVNSQDFAVRDINFSLESGKTLALVGESGSGKTLIATCLTRLLDNVLISGEVILDGQSLLKLDEKALRSVRRHKVAYIFQEPGAALDPALTVGYQLKECIEGNDVKSRVRTILQCVGFDNVKSISKAYPHELSGGMQQRVMIAMALVNRPKLLIADEPTTSLDVALQKQILDLIKKLQSEFSFAMLLITHDLSLLPSLADAVCVLKNGAILERGTPKEILENPQNQYTKLLVESLLTLPEKTSGKEQ